MRLGVNVAFTSYASLATARATGTHKRKVGSLACVPHLIINGFGLKPLRPHADDLHDLVAERYETVRP